MRFVLFSFMLSMLFFGCNKERKYIKKLDGSWKLESHYLSDQQFETNTERFIFFECDPSSEVFCPMIIETKDSLSYDLEYNVNFSESYLTVRDLEANSTNTEIIYYIDKLDKEILAVHRIFEDIPGIISPLKAEYYFIKE